MDGKAEGEGERSLVLTPTWVVAAVCFTIVAISLAAERLLHYLGRLLKHKDETALFSALQRLKEELMLLGFISFLLSVFQGFIRHICIPESAASLMLPCNKENSKAAEEAANLCKKKGEVPLLSQEALHQLHIFVFVLGLVHVAFCATTMVLGRAKMRKWNSWEKEVRQEIEQISRQSERQGKVTPLYMTLHREHRNFINEHTKGFWMRLAVASWTMSFMKQFYDSVSKLDYRALRAAFISTHYPNRLDFDFHKYMIRALEHDFKRVVGISWYLWFFVILFLLLNINGWHTYFWLSFLPLFLLLIVGAKLEHIIACLAQEAAERLADEKGGIPKIKPSKQLFWFNNPRLVLHLIHFILFQNSFEIGFFFWVLAIYGFNSCIMEKAVYAISRLVIGIIIEVLCSYSTLPLYAIVTHMSGGIKLEVFGERVETSVLGWAEGARKKNPSDTDVETPSDTEVEVTRVPNENFGSSRNMLAPFEPEEIV